MAEPSWLRKAIPRRTLLRSAVFGGSGLLGAALLGCESSGEDASPTLPIDLATAQTVVRDTPNVRLRWSRLFPPTEPPTEPSGGAIRLAPPPRRDHSLVSDGQRLYLFGGRDGAGDLGDLWAYDLVAANWAQIALEGGPGPRFGHNSVWDQSRGRVLIFGGQAGGSFLSDLWEYSPADGRWFQAKDGTGPVPEARYGAGGDVDDDGALVITHGFTSSGRFDDTWHFDVTDGWQDISPAGDRPIERCLMRAVWDSLRGRLLLFGGQTTDTPFLGDLWVLSPDGWDELARVPSPEPRTFYAMAFDHNHNRALLFGGSTEEGPVNDTWVFDAKDEFWTLAAPTGDAPSARFGHDGAWVPGRDAFVVFGGNDASDDLNDLWELSAG